MRSAVVASQPKPPTNLSGEPKPVAVGCRKSPLVWVDGPDQSAQLSYSADLDHDGRADHLAGVQSWGSTESSTHLELELSSDSSTITIETFARFDQLVLAHRVPARLGVPRLADARHAVEDALFSRVCQAPDPSLALALDGHPTWVGGQPVVVDSYAVMIEGATAARAGLVDPTAASGSIWVEYLALNHRRDNDLQLTAGFVKPTTHAPIELWLTAHGAAVVDVAHDRYAWIHLTLHAAHKLRFPSVKGGRLRNDIATIDVDGRTIAVRLPSS